MTREQQLEYERKYEKAHREQRKEAKRLWRNTHRQLFRERVKVYSKKYRANPASLHKRRELHKDWVQKNPEKVKIYNYQARCRRHGLTVAQYEAMYEEQSGCCGICHAPLPHSETEIDHNHATNKVRGLLCRRCNMVVGMTETSRDIIQDVFKWIGR